MNWRSDVLRRLRGLVTAGVVLASGTVLCRAESPAVTFESANKLYEQGKFAEAAASYEAILHSGRASVAVYFNLGNAWFKAGQIGRAISAYRQAASITPRDPDVLANLQFARNQVQGPTLAPSSWQRWLGKLSLNEWTLLAAASVWVWLLLLIVPQWRPSLKRAVRGWTVALGLTAVLLCAGFGADYFQTRVRKTTVVIVKDAVVHRSPYAEADSALTLHDGAEVHILDRKNEWLQVATDPLRIGWMKQDELLQLTAN